jgi:hypothetical protein
MRAACAQADQSRPNRCIFDRYLRAGYNRPGDGRISQDVKSPAPFLSTLVRAPTNPLTGQLFPVGSLLAGDNPLTIFGTGRDWHVSTA